MLSLTFTRCNSVSASLRTVTTKKYAQLPKNRVLPDGTISKPLPDWQGGLSDNAKPEPQNDFESDVLQAAKKSQRRRVKPAIDVTEVQRFNLGTEPPKPSTGDSSAPPSPENPPPKRTRRKRVKDGVEETVAKPKKESRSAKDARSSSEASKKLKSEETNDEFQPSSRLATEVLQNLARFPHCILLTRVGNFYESYFDQAAEVAALLNIKLTTRKFGGRRVYMCGFPLAHLDKYLKVLVQQNRKFVAMCEEYRKPTEPSIKQFDRRISRIITPGTLIDESFLNPFDNNYLLAITPTDSAVSGPFGLAWIDVSTGEFFSQTTSVSSVRDDLTRINPREVVLDKALESDSSHPLRAVLSAGDYFVTYAAQSDLIPKEQSLQTVTLPSDVITADEAKMITTSVLEQSAEEALAVKLLTSYLRANLLELMPTLPLPNREGGGRMQIDSHTITALEIRERLNEASTKGSLLSVVKRTQTSSGTRLLSRWLCSPSTSLDEINARQSLVAFFHQRVHLDADIRAILSSVGDVGRIVQRFQLNRGEAADLLAVHSTILIWRQINERIREEHAYEKQQGITSPEWDSVLKLLDRMVPFRELSDRIEQALNEAAITQDTAPEEITGDEEPSVFLPWKMGGYKWTIRPQFSQELTKLHTSLQEMLKEMEVLEQCLQQEYDAPSLTLRTSPAQGMHVHIAKSKRDHAKLSASEKFTVIAESGSTKCYFNQEWSQLGGQILDTTTALYAAERAAFDSLRNEVSGHSLELRRNARVIDELDVTLGFAQLARELNLVKPQVTDGTEFLVDGGRHPTVELGLLNTGRMFIPNSVNLESQSRMQVQTGPNQAGKSTLLRQTALIAILAQTGSFVPAKRAKIGIVDRLFSRVGAKDDLFLDRGTFMVEMMETAEVLRGATPRSLAILDEVGRGTTVEDGLAIAFATVHHLAIVNQCRTLFATHFHELADLLGYSPDTHHGQGIFKDVAFYCTDVDETQDGRFSYSYRVRPGVNRNSHGVKVAQMAGMPPSAISVASNVLSYLKQRSQAIDTSAELRALGQIPSPEHTSLP